MSKMTLEVVGSVATEDFASMVLNVLSLVCV